MTATAPGSLLNSVQTAEYLGLSTHRLKALRRAQAGPEWGRFEGTIRYNKLELDAWLNRHRPRS